MWKLKVIIQFFLAYLPFGEKVNYLLQHMKKDGHSPAKTAKRIIKLTKIIKKINVYKKIEGSSVMEIGTGWEPINVLLFYVMGAKTCYSYDHVPHVRLKLAKQVIQEIENNIQDIQLITSIPKNDILHRLNKLKRAKSLGHLFKKANIIYVAPGDATRTALPDNSIDIVYSYAVMEHVPESVIHDFTIESKRILSRDGIAYHAIGLHDHYVSFDKKISKINFLKYSESQWAFWVKNKISYHNRLREKQFVEIFKSHGSIIKWKENKIDPDDLVRIKMMKIDKKFSGIKDEELCVYFSEMMLGFKDDTAC